MRSGAFDTGRYSGTGYLFNVYGCLSYWDGHFSVEEARVEDCNVVGTGC